MTATRVGLIVAGLAMLGYGIVRLLVNGPALINYLIFAAAGLIAHDLLIAPLTLAVGAGLARLLPRSLRTPVRIALLASAVTALVALPLVLGYGHHASNPSALPLDYARGLALTVAAIWLVTGLVFAARRLRRPRRGAASDTGRDTGGRGPAPPSGEVDPDAPRPDRGPAARA